MDVNRANYTPAPVAVAPTMPAIAPVAAAYVTPAPAPATPAAPTPPVVSASPVEYAPNFPATAPAPTTEADLYNGDREVRLERAVTELNHSLTPHTRHMSVGRHEATGRTMIRVYNTTTAEVIREIPPERVLDAHASLLELAGLFMDTRG